MAFATASIPHRALILTLVFATCCSIHAQAQPFTTPDAFSSDQPSMVIKAEGEESVQQEDGKDMYGIGIRLGTYLQAFASVLGMLTLDSIDPNNQFAAIILALELLIRVSFRWNSHEIWTSELWVCLAQILMITTPGALLLFLGFSHQRRHWKTKQGKEMLREEVIRGQGLSFIQVFVVMAFAIAINIRFTCSVFFNLTPVTADSPDTIWMWRNWQIHSPFFKTFIIVQAGATTVLVGGPYLFYLSAFWRYLQDRDKIKAFFILGRRQSTFYQRLNENRRRPNIWHHFLDKLWYSFKELGVMILAAAALFYIIMLATSIELAIRANKLPAENNLRDVGELLPFLTGIVALLSALANFTTFPKMKMCEYPVRIDTKANGEDITFYKNGERVRLDGYNLAN